jgi:hypothetical protein
MTRVQFQGLVPFPPEDRVDDWGLTLDQQVRGAAGRARARARALRRVGAHCAPRRPPPRWRWRGRREGARAGGAAAWWRPRLPGRILG